jgi:hypothetical protein
MKIHHTKNWSSLGKTYKIIIIYKTQNPVLLLESIHQLKGRSKSHWEWNDIYFIDIT